MINACVVIPYGFLYVILLEVGDARKEYHVSGMFVFFMLKFEGLRHETVDLLHSVFSNRSFASFIES